MDILRPFFSFKLIIVFVLVALFLGTSSSTNADPVKCPCKYTSAYRAAKRQAEAIGQEITFDVCNETADSIELTGEDGCFAAIFVGDIDCPPDSGPCCAYLFECAVEPFLFQYEMLAVDLSDSEANACDREIRRQARSHGDLCGKQ